MPLHFVTATTKNHNGMLYCRIVYLCFDMQTYIQIFVITVYRTTSHPIPSHPPTPTTVPFYGQILRNTMQTTSNLVKCCLKQSEHRSITRKR